MRLSEIAARIAPHLNREAEEVHGALRNPALKPLLGGTPGPTPKSPTEYDAPDAVRAFVLLLSQMANLNGAEMATVARALDQPSAALQDKPGGPVPCALDAMVESITAGSRNWHLSVRFILTPDGTRVLNVRLSRDEMIVHAQRAANAERTSRGDLTVAHSFIPLGDLLAPMLMKGT